MTFKCFFPWETILRWHNRVLNKNIYLLYFLLVVHITTGPRNKVCIKIIHQPFYCNLWTINGFQFHGKTHWWKQRKGMGLYHIRVQTDCKKPFLFEIYAIRDLGEYLLLLFAIKYTFSRITVFLFGWFWIFSPYNKTHCPCVDQKSRWSINYTDRVTTFYNVPISFISGSCGHVHISTIMKRCSLRK